MTDRPVVLSTSAISAYLRCRYAYLLGYVFRLRGVQSVPAAIGQAVHAGVEALHRGEAAQNALYAAWETETANVPPAALAADPDALPDALTMLRVYKKEVHPSFRPTLVETPFTYQAGGAVISGVLDAADDDLRDTKTTAGKTINGNKPNFDPRNYDLQLALYRLGYRALTGNWPKRLLLDVLTRRGTYRQYDRTDEVNMGDAIDIVAVVRDGIAREEYEPTGALNGSCRYCAFTERCTYVVR